jgi:hypothetical protein
VHQLKNVFSILAAQQMEFAWNAMKIIIAKISIIAKTINVREINAHFILIVFHANLIQNAYMLENVSEQEKKLTVAMESSQKDACLS